MRTIPQAWRQEYIKGNRKYDITVNMTLADSTTLTITNNQIWEGGFSFEQASSSDSSFDIGSAIVGSATLILDNINENFSQYDFFNAEFNVSLGLVGANLQPITIGHYTVDETAYNGSLITLSCLDNMWRFDRPFSEITVSYPATARSIINAMCGYSGIGIQLATQSFQGYDFAIPSAPEEDMTCREVLQYVAQATCNYCVINEQGNLELKWYDKSVINNLSDYDGGSFSTNTTPYSDGVSLNGGTFAFNDGDTADGGTFYNGSDPIAYITSNFSMSVDTDDIVITGVKVCTSSDGDGSYDYSWHDSTVEQTHPRYTLVIQDNPFINENNAQSRATTIGGIVANTPLRGFDSSSLSDISIEPGDPCAIIDFRGNRFYSFVTNTRFTTSNSESFSCGVESLVQNKTVRYSNEIKTLVEAKRNAQEVVSEYDQAVQRMQQLAANAGGLYWLEAPQQGGSAIWYESDMPMSLDSSGNVVFTSGSHAWKRTANGFFSCTSTGTSEATTTWTAGIDNNNNAVMNTVSAIGINADWINAGSLNAARITAGILKDQYNYNYWNLNTGEFKLAALPAGTGISDPSAPHSGAYVPTNSNLPASGWTTEQKKQHVGETFYNTSNQKTYIYKGIATFETEHPYPAGVTNNYYHVSVPKDSYGAFLQFDSQSETETNWDYIDIYKRNYQGNYYKARFTGSIGQKYFTIDGYTYGTTNDVWIVWTTDGTVTKWGWKLDVVDTPQGTDASSSFSADTLPSYSWTDITWGDFVSFEWVEATLEEYIDVKASQQEQQDLTQEEVYNILTNNGQTQGLFLQNGKIYLNGQYFTANAITIGGSNYSQKPYLQVLNSSNDETVKLDINGMKAIAGQFGNMFINTTKRTISGVEKTYSYLTYGGNASYIKQEWEQYSSTVINASNNSGSFIFVPYAEGWTVNDTLDCQFELSFESYPPTTAKEKATQCTIKITQYNENGKMSNASSGGVQYQGSKTFWLNYEGWQKTSDSGSVTDVYGMEGYQINKDWGKNAGEFYQIEWEVAIRDNSYASDITLEISDNGNGYSFYLGSDLGSDNPEDVRCLGKFQGYFTGNASLTALDLGKWIYTPYESAWKAYSIKSNSAQSRFALLTPGGLTFTNDQGTIDGSSSSSAKWVGIRYNTIQKASGSSGYQVVWESTSDERVKKNIQPLPTELSKQLIDGTQPKSFEFIDPDEKGKRYGMIAQEARKLLDSLGETDAHLEYITDAPSSFVNLRCIHYEEYIPHLINYVKDLRSEIDGLKAEIAELKSKGE